MEWQPIETAPKGKKVLGGYINPLGNWRTVLCRYYQKHQLETEDELGDDEDVLDGVAYAPEGWYEDVDNEGPVWGVTPTHWAALPLPPAT